jgi:hypothetical protein
MAYEVDYASKPRSPWTRPGTIAAAVFLALVVIAGVLVALTGGNDDPPPPGPVAAPTTQPVDAGTSTPTKALPTAIPTTAPKDVTWELVGAQPVPVSRSAGPRQVSGGVASGYAHTPEGALIAAVQISTRSSIYVGRASWEPTITRQMIDSPDREALLRWSAQYDPPPRVEVGDLSALGGYRFVSYTPDATIIALALRSSGGRWGLMTYTLRWSSGDWRMEPPPGGEWASVQTLPNTLPAIVSWEAR